RGMPLEERLLGRSRRRGPRPLAVPPRRIAERVAARRTDRGDRRGQRSVTVGASAHENALLTRSRIPPQRCGSRQGTVRTGRLANSSVSPGFEPAPKSPAFWSQTVHVTPRSTLKRYAYR